MNKDVVLDFGRHARIVVPTEAGIASAELPQILDVQDDPRFTGDEQLIDTSFPASSASRRSRCRSRRASTHQARQAARREDAGRHALVARRGAPDGRDGRPQAVPEVGAEAQGPEAAAVRRSPRTSRGRSRRRSRRATSRASTRPRRAPSRRASSSSRRRSSSRTRSRAPATGPDMGQYGQMMPNLGGDEQLLMLAGPYAQQFVTGSILVVQEHARLADGRHRSARRQREDPQRPEPRLRRRKLEDHARRERGPDPQAEEDLKEARKDQQRNVEFFLILGIPRALRRLRRRSAGACASPPAPTSRWPRTRHRNR